MFLEPVAAITARQHGMVTTAQILATGASYAWIEWAVADGRLAPVRRGVYRVVGSPESPYGAVMAAVLAGGAGVAAGDLAAGWLWNARDIAPALPAVTAFDSRRVRLLGVTVRRSRLCGERFITVRHDIPTVTAELTVVQIGEVVGPSLAIAVANDLCKRNVTSFRRILQCLDEVAQAGRLRRLRTYTERAVGVDGHADSPRARELGAAMLEAGVPPFKTQFEVVVDGRVRHLDFAWPEQMVGLEYMGWLDHGTRQGFDGDARRRSQLTAIGWRILDATSGSSFDDIIDWVTLALGRAVSSPGARRD